MLSRIFLIALAASQVSFVLRDAAILRKPRDFFNKSSFIKELLGCKLCLNFWISLLLITAEVFFGKVRILDSFYFLFAVWAGAYIIDSAREKYLPCVKCSKQGEISTGAYQVL